MGVKKRSAVWNYFTKLTDGWAWCSICRKQLSFKGTLTNLKAHLQRKHLTEYSQLVLDSSIDISTSNNQVVLTENPITSISDGLLNVSSIEEIVGNVVATEVEVIGSTTMETVGRQRSTAWNFFTEMENGRALCSLCNKSISYKSTVANLRAHLHRKHISVYNQLQYLQDISSNINIQEGITDIPNSSIFPNSSDIMYNVSCVEEVVAEDGENSFALNVASVEEVVDAENCDALPDFSSIKQTPGQVQRFSGRQRSDVWNVFHKIDNDTAQCSICCKNISFKSTLSNLRAHLQRKHISEATEVQFLEDGTTTNLNIQDGTTDPSTSGLLLIVSSALPTTSYTAEHRLTGRQRSEIWKFFNKLGNAKAQCGTCNQVVSYKSTIYNLSSHLQRKHASLYSELQALREKSKKVPVKEVNEDEEEPVPATTESVEQYESISNQQSYVWNFFSNLFDGKAQCNLCNKKKIFKSSLANLRAHLQRKHNAIYAQLQFKADDGSNLNNEEVVADNPTVSTGVSQAESTVLTTALATASAIAMRRQKSDVWNFFNKLDNGKAECNICKTTIAYKTTIANLRVHLKRMHVSAYAQLRIHQERSDTSNIEWQITDDHTYSTSNGLSNVSYTPSGQPPAKKRKLISRQRSSVWKCFKKLNDTSALCSICNKKISFKSTTSNLMIHLKRKHISVFKQLIHLKRLCNKTNIEAGILNDLPISTSDFILDVSSEPPNGDQPVEQNENAQMDVTDDVTFTASMVTAFSTPQHNIFGRRQSTIWNIFNKTGDEKAQCTVCSREISYKSTAANLTAHVRRKHPSVYAQLVLQQEKNNELHNLEVIAKCNFPKSDIFLDNSYAEEVVLGPSSPANSDGSHPVSPPPPIPSSSVAQPPATEWQKCFYCNDINVWHHFNKVDDEKAQCSICNLKLAYKATIANLKSHLKRKHPSLYSQDQEGVMDNSIQSTSGGFSSMKKCIRCQRNNVWLFFKKLDEGKAECSICNRIISMRTTVTNLSYHLKRLHIAVYNQLPYLNDKNDSINILMKIKGNTNSPTCDVLPTASATPDPPTELSIGQGIGENSLPSNSAEAPSVPIPTSSTVVEPISGQMVSVSPTSSSTYEPKKGNSRQKSDVWKFFYRLDDDEANCSICNKNLSFKSSLCNLRNHLKRKHSYVYKHLPFLKGNRNRVNVQERDGDDLSFSTSVTSVPDSPGSAAEQQTQQLTLSRHQRNHLWKFFKKLDDLDAECNECNKIISFKLSLSSLKNHLHQNHVFAYKKLLTLIDGSNNSSVQKRTEVGSTPSTSGALSSVSLVSSNAISAEEQRLEQSKDSCQRSDVWKLFKRLDHADAQCSICNKIISFKTTMSNLRVHLKRKHVSAYNNLQFLKDKSSSSTIQDTIEKGTSSSLFSDYPALSTSPSPEKIIVEKIQYKIVDDPSLPTSDVLTSDFSASPTAHKTEQQIIVEVITSTSTSGVVTTVSPASPSLLSTAEQPIEQITLEKMEYDLSTSISSVVIDVSSVSPTDPKIEKQIEEIINEKIENDLCIPISGTIPAVSSASPTDPKIENQIEEIINEKIENDLCTPISGTIPAVSPTSPSYSPTVEQQLEAKIQVKMEDDLSPSKLEAGRESSVSHTSHSSTAAEQITEQQKGNSRQKSDVWNFFIKLDHPDAQCTICKKIVSYKSTISNLRSHLQRQHISVYRPLQLIKGKSNDSSIMEEMTNDPSILSSVVSPTASTAEKSSQQNVKNKLANDPTALTSVGALSASAAKQTTSSSTKIIPKRAKQFKLISERKNHVWSFFMKLGNGKGQCHICDKIISFKLNENNLRTHLKVKHNSAYQKYLLPEEKTNNSTIQKVITVDPIPSTSVTLSEEQLIQHQKDIWNFFKKCSDSSAQCTICKKTISFVLTLTNLRSHLKRAHNLNIQERIPDESTTSISSSASSSLPTAPNSSKPATSKKKPLEKTKKISPQKKIMVYRHLPTVEDLKPFSIASKDLLHSEADSVCITTDVWTSSSTDDSFIAITAHYITREFELKSALLQCLTLSGEHPERNISFEIRSVLAEWNVQEKVNFAIVDNALNVNDAFQDVQFQKCYTQKLDLIVKKSLHKMKSIVDKVEKIVAHYRICTFASRQLIKFQKKHGISNPKTLENDSETQWNISLMLCRFVELEEAIKATCNTLFNKLPVFTTEDWQFLRQLSEILSPFEESTNGQKYMTGGSVIVVTRCLVETYARLQNNPIYSQEIKAIISSIADGLEEELKLIENSWTFALCTLLDPRYKDHVFLDQTAVKNAKKQLECLVVACVDNKSNNNQSQILQSASSSGNTSVWNIFNELMADKVPHASPVSRASKEFERFFKDSILPRLNENGETNCPLEWWKKNQHIYPNLAEIYRKKCNIVATAASCKKLFKKQAIIL